MTASLCLFCKQQDEDAYCGRRLMVRRPSRLRSSGNSLPMALCISPCELASRQPEIKVDAAVNSFRGIRNVVALAATLTIDVLICLRNRTVKG